MSHQMERAEIEITYFKVNGRFYTRSTFIHEFPYHVHANGAKSIHPHDVVEYLKSLRNNKGTAVLPGLGNDKWAGYILVRALPDGEPRLILPPDLE